MMKFNQDQTLPDVIGVSMRNRPRKPPPKAETASDSAPAFPNFTVALPSGPGPCTENCPSQRLNRLQRSAEGATSLSLRGKPCSWREIAFMSSSVRLAAEWDRSGEGMDAAADCKHTEAENWKRGF